MIFLIVGPSKLSRSSSPVLLGVYLIVSVQNQRLGVARLLERYCFEIACSYGFHMCVSDVYTINSKGTRLAQSLGYKVQGSVMHSGYFRDFGYVDTLLYYKICKSMNIIGLK